MGDGSWLIGVLTALTALGASWITGRGNARSARVRADVEAHANHMTEARNRRRDAYRELSASVHALSEVFWRMEDVDRIEDADSRVQAINQMQVASRTPLNAVTKASRDVLLEGPTPVADAATGVRAAAAATYLLLFKLSDGTGEQRGPYDTAYQELRTQHLKFIELARHALEVRRGAE